jgi:hypothetical protein
MDLPVAGMLVALTFGLGVTILLSLTQPVDSSAWSSRHHQLHGDLIQYTTTVNPNVLVSGDDWMPTKVIGCYL